MPGRTLGSPPRRRGKEVADEGIGGIIRITSAWAGKRCSSGRCCMRQRDHPRVGGEKWFIALLFEPCEGSPPAWAGKSLFCFAAAVPIQDHPRIGGEKGSTSIVLPMTLGSPPHGRGKGQIRPRRGLQRGITPAWAGKRPRLARSKYPGQDHPRMGGEKPNSRRMSSCRVGSPPRRRGKARHLSHGLLPCG